MNPVAQNIIIGASGLAITAAFIVWVVTHFKLFKLKGEIQEDLANTYSPDILGATIVKKEAEVNADQSEEPAPEAETEKEQ